MTERETTVLCDLIPRHFNGFNNGENRTVCNLVTFLNWKTLDGAVKWRQKRLLSLHSF